MRVVTGVIASRHSSFATALDLCADGFAGDPPKKQQTLRSETCQKPRGKARIVLLSAAR